MTQPSVKKLSDLNIGDKIKFGKSQIYGTGGGTEDIVWTILSKDHFNFDSRYPQNTVTLITDRIINKKVIDAPESNNDDPNRKLYGNNRYLNSNIRQWLNSDGAENAWFSPQNMDTPSGGNYNNRDVEPVYSTERGFLNLFQQYEKDAIVAASLKTSLNIITDGDVYSSDIHSDKIFLLSMTEVGLGDNRYFGDHAGKIISEGYPFAYFSSNDKRKAKPSQLTYDKFYNIWMSEDTVDTPQGWFLRSSKLDSAISIYWVKNDGSLGSPYGDSYDNVSKEYALRPTTNLKYDTLVTATPDSSGVYSLVPNLPPFIKINSVNFLDIKYNVLDLKSNPVETKIYLNNNLKQTITSGFDSEFLYEIPFAEISVGSNELKFTTLDDDGLTGEQRFDISVQSLPIPSLNDEVIVSGRKYNVLSSTTKSDGTVDVNLDQNIHKTALQSSNVERMKSDLTLFGAITNDINTPTFVEMNHVKTSYNDDLTEAIEEWELTGLGSYAHTKVTIARDDTNVNPSVRKISQIFRYNDEL